MDRITLNRRHMLGGSLALGALAGTAKAQTATRIRSYWWGAK